MEVTVLLTLRCRRRGHLLARVVADPGPTVAAPRYGSAQAAARFALTRGAGHRYACGCGSSAFVFDDRLLGDIGRGVRLLIIDLSNDGSSSYDRSQTTPVGIRRRSPFV